MLSSHIKIQWHISHISVVLDCFRLWMVLDLCIYPDSDKTTFHWRKQYYGMEDSYFDVQIVLLMDLVFFTNIELFTSQGINRWTGVVWITCDVFISCLDSHSDGTHSLQSIHWWASDVMLHFSKSVPMKKKLIYILDGLRVSTFSAKFHTILRLLLCKIANIRFSFTQYYICFEFYLKSQAILVMLHNNSFFMCFINHIYRINFSK